MRRLGTALAVLAALAATPSFAFDVKGFYAGFYGGVSQRNDTTIQTDAVSYGISPGGPVRTPTDFVNQGGKLDPLLLGLLERGIRTVDFPSSAGPTGPSPNLLTDGTLSFDRGRLTGFVFGYDFGGVRVDADVSATAFDGATYHETSARGEASYGFSDMSAGKWTWIEAFDVPTLTSKEDTLEKALFYKVSTDVQFFLVDGYYDIDTGTAFSPYLGGGIGVARVTSTMTDVCGCVAGDPNAVNSSTAIVPAAQIGGGVRVALAKPVTLDVGYRYRVAANPNAKVYEIIPFDVPFFTGFNGLASQQSGIIGIHSVTAGLTFALQ